MTLQVKRTVRPRDIESALGMMWHEMVVEGRNVRAPRASVLNLVIYADDAMEGVLEQARRIVANHPGRVIVLRAEPGVERPEAEIGVLPLSDEPSQPPLYAECVGLSVGPRTASYLPALALPLLNSALPTVLWWAGDKPLDTEVFPALAGIADRTIIDSSRFPNPITDLRRLAELAKEGGRWSGLGDLAWGRLLWWRQLTAQFFDHGAARMALDRLDRVVLRYGTRFGNRADVNPGQALLYTGWLADRLRWNVSKAIVDDGAFTARFARGNQRVEVDARGEEVDCRWPGELTEARLRITRGETAHFEVHRMHDGAAAMTESQVNAAPVMSRVAHLQAMSLERLLDHEVRLVQHDATYRGALVAAGQVLAA